MTRAKYERLGRAVVAAVKLAEAVDAIHDEKVACYEELKPLVGSDAARATVSAIVVDALPAYRVGEIVRKIVFTAEAANNEA